MNKRERLQKLLGLEDRPCVRCGKQTTNPVLCDRCIRGLRIFADRAAKKA